MDQSLKRISGFWGVSDFCVRTVNRLLLGRLLRYHVSL